VNPPAPAEPSVLPLPAAPMPTSNGVEVASRFTDPDDLMVEASIDAAMPLLTRL
jgi:hypothetical protein